MNPVRIRNRTDLVLYARDHVQSHSCERAIVEGRVECLGGFTRIPPKQGPGWMLKVTSRHDRVWLIAVTADDIKHTYQVWQADEIPWKFWDGLIYPIFQLHEPTHGLRNGDKPEAYNIERALTLESRRTS